MKSNISRNKKYNKKLEPLGDLGKLKCYLSEDVVYTSLGVT